MKTNFHDVKFRLRNKEYVFWFYDCWDFFNPFKRRDAGCIVPIFEFLPHIGFSVNAQTSYFGFHAGWLNMRMDLHLYHGETIQRNCYNKFINNKNNKRK